MSNPESATPSPANAGPITPGARAYVAPKLTQFGALQGLTASGTATGMENMGAMFRA